MAATSLTSAPVPFMQLGGVAGPEAGVDQQRAAWRSDNGAIPAGPAGENTNFDRHPCLHFKDGLEHEKVRRSLTTEDAQITQMKEVFSPSAAICVYLRLKLPVFLCALRVSAVNQVVLTPPPPRSGSCPDRDTSARRRVRGRTWECVSRKEGSSA